MTKSRELTPDVMSPGTGLHPNQTDRQVGQAGLQLPARDLPAQHDPAARIYADEMEGVLTQVIPIAATVSLLVWCVMPCLFGCGTIPSSHAPPGSTAGPCHYFPTRLAEIATNEADGQPLEIWFADEASIGQKNKITRRWARLRTR